MWHLLRPSESMKPYDRPPALTWGDLRKYCVGMLEILEKLLLDDVAAISTEASKALPGATSAYAQLFWEDGTSRLESLAKLLILPESKLEAAETMRTINFILDDYQHRIADVKLQPDLKVRLEACIDRLRKAKEIIETSLFPTRLRRWAGAWTRDDDDPTLQGEQSIPRYKKMLQELAHEAIENPSVLDETTLSWLCTSEASKGGAFLRELGSQDKQKVWLGPLQKLAVSERNAHAFGCYCDGLASLNLEQVEKFLDDCCRQGTVHPKAILYATHIIEGTPNGVKRITKLVHEGLVDPAFVGRVLSCGRWVDGLEPGAFLGLLRVVAGKQLEHAGTVVDLVCKWHHLKHPLDKELRELAWRCLEAKRPVSRQETWDYDELATLLFQEDPERGFRLVAALLKSGSRKECWNPIDRLESHQNAWRVLLKADRERALRMLFDLCQTSPLVRYKITWSLKDVLDLEQDKDLLLRLSDKKEEVAEILSECLATARTGFWPIALHLAERYHTQPQILSNLGDGVRKYGSVISGPMSLHLSNCLRTVEEVLALPETPARTRPWLRKLCSHLKEEARRESISEKNCDVIGYGQDTETDDETIKHWGVEQLIKGMGVDRTVQLLGKAELKKVLPTLNLPKEQKEAVSEALG